jgi:ribosomal protein L10
MSKDQCIATIGTIDELAESLKSQAISLEQLFDAALADAYQRGIKDGAGVKIKDLQGKTLLVYTQDDPGQVCKSLEGLAKEFDAKIVVLQKDDDLKELHELELKALGLKKLEDT